MSDKRLDLTDLRVVYEVLDSHGNNVRDMIGLEVTFDDLVEIMKNQGGEVQWICHATDVQPGGCGPDIEPWQPRKHTTCGRYLILGPLESEEKP